ncbi:acyl-CoA dehydrogenase family protein [Streptomyces sp. B3I8]|uniref:acyl-CoA dehydrogenase family protein n=1 Tax=Streptomyces sp. B3I8 TaxID=3042303 RepID=UPI0027D84A0C|nr:acyl-CoA dehydrogenase family protein [Streptomyces sp. B3I8]
MADFLQEAVDPTLVDTAGKLPDGLVREYATRGYLSMRQPLEQGGLGLSALNAFRLVRTAAEHSMAAAFTLALHTGFGAAAYLPLLNEGETSADILRACAEGALFGDADTEQSGAANTARATTATPVPEGYILSGEKIFVHNAAEAGLLLVSATVRGENTCEPALFLVDPSSPGFSLTSRHQYMGLRGADNAVIHLDEVFVPRGRMLAGPCPDRPGRRVGPSGRALRETAARGRLYPIAAPSLAVGRLGTQWMRDFARRRSVDGLPLGEHDEIQRLLAVSLADVFAMEGVVEWCLLAEERRPGLNVVDDITAAKNITSLACWRIIDRTLSVTATEGLETAPSKLRRGVPPLPVERFFRDARALRIAGGVDFLVDYRAARDALSALSSRTSQPVQSRRRACTATGAAMARLTARNRGHLQYATRQSAVFASVCRALTARHPDPADLHARQRTLIQLSRVSSELFTMAVVLARAARMTTEGDSTAQTLADVFCEEAGHRIDDAMRRLTRPQPADHARLSAAWMDGEGFGLPAPNTLTDPPSAQSLASPTQETTQS